MKDLSEAYITRENKEWIEVLSTCDPKKFRQLLKKERLQMPSKYKTFYKESDKRITEFMYTLILYAPGLTHLKTRARNYFRHINLGMPFVNENCRNCRWFLQAPIVEENPELISDRRSCKELGAIDDDSICEGFLKKGEK